jgi:hypothetical protein
MRSQNCDPHAPPRVLASHRKFKIHRQQDAEDEMPTRATSSTHPIA